MKKLLRVSLIAACAVISTGCVTKKNHAALQSDLDDARAVLENESRRSSSLEEALQQREREVESLEEEISGLEQELETLEDTLARGRAKADEDLRKLESDLAEVIKDRSKLKASIDEMKDALADARERKRQADIRVAEYRDLLARFKALIDAGRLEVKIVDGRMVVVLSMDILFDSGSAKLSEEGGKTVEEITEVLASIPNKRFQIEGHTDTVPINTKRYPSNWELGSARALSIVKKMVEGGMPPERVSGASFGEFHPTASNETDEGKAKNRRIEIVVVPDLSGLPGAEELERTTR